MTPDKPRFSGPKLSAVVATRNLFRGSVIDHHLIASGPSFEALVVRQNVFAGQAGNDIVLATAGVTGSLEVAQNTSISDNAIAVGGACLQGPLRFATICGPDAI